MIPRPDRPTRYSKPQQLVVALIPALIVTLSITGFVWAHKQVTLVVDGQSRVVSTQASDVAGALADAGVSVRAADLISPSSESELADGDVVVVRHAVPVTVSVGDHELDLDVVGDTVADALVAAGLDPVATTGVSPPLGAPLQPGMDIAIPDVVVRVETEDQSVAPEIKRQADRSLPIGEERVVDPGQPGKIVRVFRVVITDGVETAPVLAAEEVVREPQPRVVAVGTGARNTASATATGARRAGRARVSMVATGYSPAQPGLGKTTATGARARRGVVAVDPAVIPLGTRVFVPGYGIAVAADTGGAIRGNRIDLCFETVAQALAWGRRTVTVAVLD